MTSLVAPRLTTRLGPGPVISGGLGFVAAALFGLTALEPGSGYAVLSPSLCGLGIGLGLVVVASAEAVIGNVPEDDSGLAGGLQATAVQLGGVLGASVLGSIVASRATSVLPAKLGALGLGPGVHRLLVHVPLVSQGLSAGGRGPARIERVIAAGSHAAFMSGLHVALAVGALVALVGALAGLFIRRGDPGAPAPVVHL
jgi:hypothetical protein